jgi:nucleoside-diphosphate-sugar epimerase
MNLVTGGTGLVGAHLIFDLLNRGEAVRALRRGTSDDKFLFKVFDYYADDPGSLIQKIEWAEADILDYYAVDNAMNGISKVYHSAAMVSFLPENRDEMMQVNIDGTANIVNAALVNSVAKVCHVSSIAALGRPEENKSEINENIAWKPSRNNSGYAISKYGAEREVWRGVAEGLNAVIVNPSIILGVADPMKGSSRIFSTVWKGLKFYPPGINGFVDVLDVVRAMVELMHSDISGERFILNGVNERYQNLFSTIAGHFVKPAPTIRTNKFLTGMAWRAEMLKHFLFRTKPLITKETARTATNTYSYSTQKIEEMLGFKYTGFDKTLANLCEYYAKEFTTTENKN